MSSVATDETSAITTSDVATATTTPTTTTPAASTTTANPTTTTTLPPTTSVVTAEPSTSYAPAPTTAAPAPTTVVTSITSVVTQTPTNTAQTQGPIITTITSTQPVVTYTPSYTQSTGTSSTSTSATASQSALNPSGQSKSSSGGLSNGATIAIAVIIPIIAVVGFVLFGLWFWRRRKAKKHAEEERKNDMAEYGFNPNNDPTLPVGAAAYTDGGSEGNDDSGYRGWGTTSSANRKPSTTLGSNSRAAGGGQGLSETGSQPGGYNSYGSPSAGAASDEPIMNGYEGAVAAGAIGGAGAGAAMASGPRSRHSGISSGIHRGVSNASSAYSHGMAPSEVSDTPEVVRPYYQEEVPYNVYNENQTGHGQYDDGAYGGPGDEPVIRDVQARRNTRIERAPTFPQQGQGGIATNF